MNRYSLWRYILLVIMIVVGVIYALPNLPAYGDDYAVQITTKDGSSISADVANKVTSALNSQKIPYKSIAKQQNNSYLVRFATNAEQTHARDVIQATLGGNYAVAYNLAPKTPAWLRALGAKPMKLGLDLRGGIHFLLKVDVADMLKERAKGDIHSMGMQLRDANIRYAGITALGGQQGILIRFRDADAAARGEKVLVKNFSDYTFTQKQQGTEYVLQAVMLPQQIINQEQYAITQNINILNNRVNQLGVAEPRIVQQGKNQISVDLPGIQNTARAKDLLGKFATVQMQLVDIQHNAASAQASGITPFGSTLYNYQGQPVLLKNQIILSGKAITNATSNFDQNGRPAVSIVASGPEVSLFNKVTAENIGKPMAVVYTETHPYKVMQDGRVLTKFRKTSKVISIATINSALGGQFQITGLDSAQYAKNLALLLRSGALSAQMSFVQEQVVQATLGKENIAKGALACLIGSLAVFVFMALYYYFFGIIADLALILNVIFLIAIMSILGFTLTLPGIAAIILTVGMAVDANVLIYERIREELRLGMSPQAAIHAGYGRAFTTIVDANVTTLIVAVVLFALGTGPVQGFAVSLTIGLLASMVTSIFFTRAIVNLVYGGRNVKWISIGIKNRFNHKGS